MLSAIKKMKWAGKVEVMGEKSYTYRVFGEES
jgi:hypothetical protein